MESVQQQYKQKPKSNKENVINNPYRTTNILLAQLFVGRIIVEKD
jgi:hypothetical protein